jgi:hypothetical protein
MRKKENAVYSKGNMLDEVHSFSVVLFGSRPLTSVFFGRLYLLYIEKKDQEIGWEVDIDAEPNKAITKSAGRLEFITSTGIGELFSLGSSKLST